MSQELDNNIKTKISLQSFIKENSKKIIFILGSIIISLIIFFFISIQNEKKKYFDCRKIYSSWTLFGIKPNFKIH